jgi:hypothetical protein
MIVGFINTIFGYSIYGILIYSNYDVKVAVLAATILGIFFNFFTYRKLFISYPFRPSIFIKFLISYSSVYIFNIYILNIISSAFGFNLYLAQFFCIIPCVFLNWILLRHFVYIGK